MIRLLLVASILLVALAVFTVPRRHEIDGISMAPALRPGDIVSSGWLPQSDHLVPPRRFERWLLRAPDGTPVIKRVVGLPGETIRISGGDLVIDDSPLLTPPMILAECASAVADCGPVAGHWQRSFSREDIYDDADFAPEESRWLLPVRDVGLAAVINSTQRASITTAIRIGDRAIRWSLPAGRFALVAGRLDGHLVATAWNLAASPASIGRSPLPPHPPEAWQIVTPWVASTGDRDALPLLALSLAADDGPLDATVVDRCVERCLVWRDMLHRPPAEGTASWEISSGEIFVLGDFPSGSRDSRHWGPLPVNSLFHRAR